MLFSRLELSFERLEVSHDDCTPFDLEHPFRLKAGEIARYQFAYGADLRG